MTPDISSLRPLPYPVERHSLVRPAAALNRLLGEVPFTFSNERKGPEPAAETAKPQSDPSGVDLAGMVPENADTKACRRSVP